MSHKSNENQIMVFNWRKWKPIHDITMFQAPKKGCYIVWYDVFALFLLDGQRRMKYALNRLSVQSICYIFLYVIHSDFK